MSEAKCTESNMLKTLKIHLASDSYDIPHNEGTGHNSTFMHHAITHSRFMLPFALNHHKLALVSYAYMHTTIMLKSFVNGRNHSHPNMNNISPNVLQIALNHHKLALVSYAYSIKS